MPEPSAPDGKSHLHLPTPGKDVMTVTNQIRVYQPFHCQDLSASSPFCLAYIL